MSSLPATFRSFEIRGFGDASTTVVLNANSSMPTPGPDQVLVRIASAATNPADLLLIENSFVAKMLLPEANLPSKTIPLRIGCDFAGTVVQVGENAANTFKVGDEVYGFPKFHAMGSFAEYLAVDAEFVTHKPKGLSFNEAAAVPLVSQTSYQALVDVGNLHAGERVLILGGSSATGGFAIQIAKALGATVIASTSSRNGELVKSFGADQVIDYTSQDWAEVLEPHSIDLVYDCGVEPDSWNDRAQRVLKKDAARFVTIGRMTGEPIESPIGAKFDRLFANSSAACLKKVSDLIEGDKVKPIIDSVFPFEELPVALAKQKTKRARGKIVIEVNAKP